MVVHAQQVLGEGTSAPVHLPGGETTAQSVQWTTVPSAPSQGWGVERVIVATTWTTLQDSAVSGRPLITHYY